YGTVRAAFTEVKTYFSYELWTPSLCLLYGGLAKQGNIFIKRGRVIRASPVALWSKKNFPLSLSPAVQIYWTVLNKSSQVTENTRSVSAVEKLSIIFVSPLKNELRLFHWTGISNHVKDFA
ncbi:MAG: hypothetical protein NTY29_02960, partial [Proteobacteria bacterium]|nr:hypothetical protein [Pseudomonadota bacterium]